MDPDANLAEQRRLAERLMNQIEDGPPSSKDAYRLAELVEALDGWIRNGGFLPKAWRPKSGD